MSPKKNDLSVVFSTRSFLVNIHNNVAVDVAFHPILPGHVGTDTMAGTAHGIATKATVFLPNYCRRVLVLRTPPSAPPSASCFWSIH